MLYIALVNYNSLCSDAIHPIILQCISIEAIRDRLALVYFYDHERKPAAFFSLQ